ncbi:MAG TPA: Lrp/AsnC ligand binding domain-containing protein [Gemmatimonadaceae bacterium]|nr:Lrp/AsnC ligand binding domain-containing protein [Gemmatimonadaceae bacterium]
MITTIVLVKAEPRLIPECAKHLAAIEGVTDVYSVSGEWDLVVLVKVPQYDDIAKIVTERFPLVPGLARTTTLTAFKAYSKADLEQGWDVGSA